MGRLWKKASAIQVPVLKVKGDYSRPQPPMAQVPCYNGLGHRHGGMNATATKTVATPQAAWAERQPRTPPMYHVILLDDDDHSYDYVIEMLGKLFGHGEQKAFVMAEEVDSSGRVIVDTTMLERAEFKRDQIHAYGADWRMERCKGSMSAVIEAAEPG